MTRLEYVWAACEVMNVVDWDSLEERELVPLIYTAQSL